MHIREKIHANLTTVNGLNGNVLQNKESAIVSSCFMLATHVRVIIVGARCFR